MKSGTATLVAVTFAAILFLSSVPSSFAAEFKTFDGNDKIDVPNAAKFQLATFNVEVKFRIQQAPTERGFLVSKGSTENGNDVNDQNYALSLLTSRKVTGGFKAWDDTYHYVTSGAAVSLNAWHIAKLIYDGSKVSLQIDGNTVASKTVSKNADKSGTGPLRIGANANSNNGFFVGDMDYVKIVDRNGFTTVYSNSFNGGTSSTNCSTIPVKNFKGVVFLDNTLGRHEDGGPSTLPPTAPEYVAESMKYIKSNGFNAIRVPYYWEAHEYNKTAFISRIDLIAKTAQSNGLCVIFSNFHYYTTSYWNLEIDGKPSGRGFPSFVIEDYPVTQGDYIATAGPFWTDFLSNGIVIGGKKVWDVQFIFMSQVINKVKSYNSVAGFEIMNEPHLFSKDQYDKLGNYHTYMAKKIRSITDKKIFFDRETTRGFPRDSSLEYKIVPDGVSKLVYAPQLYAVPTPGSNGMVQIENFKTWSQQWGTEVFVCEWGSEDQDDVEAFLKAFKANGFGWAAFAWKNTGSSGLGVTLYESSSVPRTSGLQTLVDAMNVVY